MGNELKYNPRDGYFRSEHDKKPDMIPQYQKEKSQAFINHILEVLTPHIKLIVAKLVNDIVVDVLREVDRDRGQIKNDG